MTRGHTLSFDGAWAHERWSLLCFVSLIDIDLAWVVDFEMVDGLARRE
jgi:hypothetical protein